jgi:hypothetical protein
MLITAHGGALGTGRNTPEFFETVKGYAVDVIEVDVYKKKDLLYISHLPKILPRKALTLEFVFDFIKEYGFKVNCDLKMRGILKDVVKLAQQKNVADRLIFTGAVSKKDLPYAAVGDVYLNAGFFCPIFPKTKNLGTIKDIIGNLNNANIKGLNLHYSFCDWQMLDKAKELNLALSVYTVDKEKELLRLMKRKELANITTNIIDKALEIKDKI